MLSRFFLKDWRLFPWNHKKKFRSWYRELDDGRELWKVNLLVGNRKTMKNGREIVNREKTAVNFMQDGEKSGVKPWNHETIVGGS